jgi:hypothetical protein
MGQGRSVKELNRRPFDPIVAPRRGRPSGDEQKEFGSCL